MTISISNNLPSRGELYKQYSKRLGIRECSFYEGEIAWNISGYCAVYPEIGQHLDYDMFAVSRIYGVSVYTARRTLVDYLSRLSLVEMCAAYLHYVHSVYDNPFGDNEGGLRL